MTAALVLFVAAATIFGPGVIRILRDHLPPTPTVDDLLAVDARDLDGNVAWFDGRGVTR